MTGSSKVYKVGIDLGGNELVRPKLGTTSLLAAGEIGFTGSYLKFYHGGVERAIGGTSSNALRLDEFANPTGSVNLNSQKITNLANPLISTDAANKAYVDTVALGLDPKKSVRVATTEPLPAVTYDNSTFTLTADVNGILPDQDEITLVPDDRILIKNQSSGIQNGIYVVTSVGSAGSKFIFTRAEDADDSPDGELTTGAYMYVEQGTANGGSGWVLTTANPITIGSTALTFSKLYSVTNIVAGNGLTLDGNTLDVGAGTGISVSANAVAVDTSVVARKHIDTSTVTGDDTTTDFTITHSLSNQWVSVTVINESTLEDEVVDVERTSTSACTVKFAVAPTTGTNYTVLVIG